MTVMLFDWVCGGHHELYMRRFAEALRAQADVVVAAPDATIDQLSDLDLRAVRLGSPRPGFAGTGQLAVQRRKVLAEEVRLLAQAGFEVDADLAIHLHADVVLPNLVRRRTLSTPLAVLLFYPRAHYPAAFGTSLGRGERVRARARELLIATWRRRRDACALLTLDEEAARRWGRQRGAPAHWIPEPPVASIAKLAVPERRGCVVYGAIGERKGLDLLARAVSVEPTPVTLTIAGETSEAFAPLLDAYVAEMQRGGATVELRTERHDEVAGLQALAGARCVLLAYERQYGMSRVLLEACSVGTPVIVHDRGLIGHLVKRYRLGRAVDCRNARQFRAAILEMTREGAHEAYARSLESFAQRYSADRFEQAVLAPLAALDPSRDGRETELAGTAA